jgi:hypothetical protein
MIVVRAFVFGHGGGTERLDPRLWWALGGLTLIHWLNYRQVFARWWRRLPEPVFALGYGACWPLVLLFIPAQYKPFIYFQF